MTIWKPGMKAVCVVEYQPYRSAVSRWPQKGDVLTVRDFYKGVNSYNELVGALRFVEIENGTNEAGLEWGYSAARFRPIVERKTDISIFEALLKPQPAGINA